MIINLLHRVIRFRYHQLGFQDKTLKQESCILHFYLRVNPRISRLIVFIHGLGTSSSTWIKILPSLLEYGTIVCIDLPGFGFSRITNGTPFFPLEQLDKSLENFIAHITREPVTLVAHSLGGWLAARFAVQRPRQVHRLILINNAGVEYRGVEEQAKAFKATSTADVQQLLNRMWFRYPWYFKPFTLFISHNLRSKHVSDFVESIEEKDFINASLSSLTNRVDVIWGKEDKLIAPESIKIMKARIPHLQLHTIPHCGHVPQLERPRELAILLKQILGQNNHYS